MPAIALFITMSLLAVDSSLAQSLSGDTDRGHKVARQICEQCHVIEGGFVGANDRNAPEFWAIADDPAVTAISL